MEGGAYRRRIFVTMLSAQKEVFKLIPEKNMQCTYKADFATEVQLELTRQVKKPYNNVKVTP